MRAKHQAGKAAQTTGGDNDVRSARMTRKRSPCASRCELLTASTARAPVPKLPYAAGAVNVLALAVIFHGGVDLALST
jgi:hypothetical protein